MSMPLSVILIIAACLIAAIITWLFSRSNSSREIGSLQTQLDQERKLHQQSIESQKQLTIEKKEYESAKAEADRLKTIAETSLQGERNILAVLKKEKQDEHNRMSEEINQLRQDNLAVKTENSGLKAQHDEAITRIKEQQQFVEEAQKNLKDAFGTLAGQALKDNNESFITLANTKLDEKVTEANGELEKRKTAIDGLVKPLAESLTRMDDKINSLETKREGAYSNMNTLLEGLQRSTQALDKGNQNLVNALKHSGTRGKYGEIGLRRVVEFAGMTRHCDFIEQVSVTSDEGILRPDMIINLPEKKIIVTDSKVPLDAYLKIFETENEAEQKQYMTLHAKAVRDHLKRLSAKAYWSQFAESPDYVVLYMQIESSFGAALTEDPSLIGDAIQNNVIFATPTTLITLLRTVGFVWQQRNIAENIEEIRDAGIELYNRTTTLLKHFTNMGSSLKTAVGHYNAAVSSVESRFIPQAKRLYTLGAAYTKNVLPETEPIEIAVRELNLPAEDKGEEMEG